MAWFRRLANVLRPARLARDVRREMEFHLAERRDQLIAAGMDREEAAREAAKRFGNRLLQEERTRDVDGLLWLDSLVADLRYALRGLVRHPGFAVVTILSLALGIGANTAIFSLTNALLLRSLPVREPGALMKVTQGEPGADSFTNPLWEAIRDRADVFSGVFAYNDQRFDLARGGPSRRVRGALVSGGFFSTLGVAPAAGRLLGPADDVRGCSPVAVVGAGFARREFGGVDAAIGRELSVDRHAVPVVGVAETGFAGINVGAPVDLYLPLCGVAALADDPKVLDLRSRWFLQIVGRLAPGVTPARARAALGSIAPAVFAATLPGKWSAEDQKEYLASKLDAVPAATGLSDLRDRYGRALQILAGIVALVLLVACANIAHLLLARAAARQAESSIRRALGAGRGRLVRQQLTETMLLALIGAAAGLLFARWASSALVRFVSTPGRDVALDLSLDGRVLGFTLLVALATGLAFGVAPALFASRALPPSVARGGERGVVDAGARHRVGKALVAAQVALSLLLVVGAGLLVGSFRRLSTLDPGFRAGGVLVVEADFTPTGLAGESLALARRDLLADLRALPDVESASASLLTPIGHMRWNELLVVPGYAAKGPRDAMAYFNGVSDRYFATLGTPLLAGRDFGAGDLAGAPRVAIVNRTFARKFLGAGDVLGKTFATRVGDGASPPLVVVGVVGDAKYSSLDEEPPPTVYQPFAQVEDFGAVACYSLRARGSIAGLAPTVQRTIAARDRSITLDFGSLDEQLSASLARPRLLATLSGFFGALALGLAVIGLYGTLSYAVARRRGEIGVRMALGAGRGAVVRLFVGEAGRLVAVGVAFGVGLAIAATRLVASFLYGVEATDPATLAGAAAVLAATALASALIPALRAARVPPAEILRQ